jgi:uncharacterized protein YcbK (DUF882 family)
VAFHYSRRNILGLGAAAAASLIVTRPALAVSAAPRVLKFRNTHTGESLATTYWADGAYVPEALDEIKKVLRDHRNGAEHVIDRRLLDLLVDLRTKLDTGEHFEVISGYRSPQSNALMHKASHGVAKHSLHMEGQAIDIRIPGRDLKLVHRAALSMKRGGVGYYPASDFVHVDCGRVRQWGQRES